MAGGGPAAGTTDDRTKGGDDSPRHSGTPKSGSGVPGRVPPAGFSKILERRRLRMPRDPVTRRGAARGRVTCRTVRRSHYGAFPDAGQTEAELRKPEGLRSTKFLTFRINVGLPRWGHAKGGLPCLACLGFRGTEPIARSARSSSERYGDDSSRQFKTFILERQAACLSRTLPKNCIGPVESRPGAPRGVSPLGQPGQVRVVATC